MKLILLLIASLLDQSSYLIKQGSTEVHISDVDAYVYLLPNDLRGGFAEQKNQIEQNIFTILNMNIVYQYLMDSDTNLTAPFIEVSQKVNEIDLNVDDEFFDKLAINKEQSVASIKQFMLKKEFYRVMLDQIKNSVTKESTNDLMLEHYMVNKSKYIKPEQRDLSVIVIESPDGDEDTDVLNLVKTKDQTFFQQKALEVSADKSVKLNEGHWGKFRKSDFKYHFADLVFAAGPGVIDQVFDFKGDSYIIRVNDIEPAIKRSFEESKQDIFKELKDKIVVRKFQNIINTQARFKIEVNPETTAHIFERYKVFIEE